MRIQNSARNGIFGALKVFSQILMKFIVRTLFIKILGEELLGLDSLFSSILSVLSLAELGFGSVIVFSMYKPVAEHNDAKVAALLNIYKKLYLIIGLSILVVGTAVSPFLSHLINGTPPDSINMYVVFFIFLLNTVSGYMLSYKRSILYTHQRNDIENKVGTIIIFALHTLQILSLLLFKNYYIHIALMPVFAILENIILAKIVDKIYGKFDKTQKLPKAELKLLYKNMRAMVGHKIGGVAVFSTDNILMSAFFGLSVVGLYNNYYLLLASVSAFLSVFIRALTASIGDSIASESVEKNYRNFKELSFLHFWILGVCVTCFLCLFQPFIQLWLGEKFLLDFYIVVAIVVSFLLTNSRTVVNTYKDVTGTFYNDRYKPYIEAVVNLGGSILLAYWLGLVGIILGTILSTLFVIPVETNAVFKHYFKMPQWKYYIRLLLRLLIIGIVAGITFLACYFIPAGIGFFVLKVLICLILPNCVFLLLSFKTEEFKKLKSIVSPLFKKVLAKIKRKKTDIK